MLKSVLSLFGFLKKNKKYPLKELSVEEFENSKFKARIAFIDDEEISHVKRLQEDGYNIVHFTDIEGIDDFIRKKFHVVILDIQGVGQEIAPETEGWGILKYLKEECPNMVVIMFTGAEWSITKYKDEASKADDFIGKDLEFLDFKSKLDNGIKKSFSPMFHFEIEKKMLMKELANRNTIHEIKEIVDNYGADRNVALDKIRKVTNNRQVLDRIDKFLSIVSSIKGLFV